MTLVVCSVQRLACCLGTSLPVPFAVQALTCCAGVLVANRGGAPPQNFLRTRMGFIVPWLSLSKKERAAKNSVSLRWLQDTAGLGRNDVRIEPPEGGCL